MFDRIETAVAVNYPSQAQTLIAMGVCDDADEVAMFRRMVDERRIEELAELETEDTTDWLCLS